MAPNLNSGICEVCGGPVDLTEDPPICEDCLEEMDEE